MATFKAIIFTGGKHIKQDGTTNIKIRIYHNGSPQYVPTQYYVKPDEMGDDGTIVSSSESSDILNYELGQLIQRFRGICIKLGTSRTAKMSCKELKEEIEKYATPDSEYIDFVAFSKAIISKTVKRKTAEWYESSLNALINFLGTDRIDVKDIKNRTLEEFMVYLMGRKIIIKSKIKGSPDQTRLMEPGTINNYLRGIRSLYNKAKKEYNNEDYDIIKIPNNPFSKITIPEYVRKRKNLSIDDILKIRDAKFDRERTNMARDVFMMLFYMMGINMNDFFSIVQESYGRIVYERSKVTTIENKRRLTLSIKIEPELRHLIDKYSNGTFLSYFRMRYSDYNNFLKAVNKELKEISKELNLGVPLSTNWARHSWASIARNKACVAKADVDFCLGHVNNDYKMADIYIDIDYSVCDRANRAVLDLLKKASEKKEAKKEAIYLHL